MTARARPDARWTMSFADLCLVLLAFLLLLQAHRGDPRVVGAGIRRAFGGPAATVDERLAAPLFERDEAVLRPDARESLAAIGRGAARAHATVRIESRGSDAGGARLDRWELAAARAAAIARGIGAGGLDPARIDLGVGGMREAGAGAGQRVRIVTGG